MKKITKMSLAVLAGFVLSACGSSGGGSDDHHSVNGTVNTATSDSNSSSDSSAQANHTDSTNTGAALVVLGPDENLTEKIVALTDSNTEYLNVEGKSIRVDYKSSGIYAGTWLNMNELKACCGKYSAMRFGVLDSEKEDTTYIFYNGTPTTSMPTTGSATYNGHAVIAGETAQFEKEDWLTGTSQFNVDFGTKKLSGTLSVDTLEPINITADVSGNSFTGTANSNTFASQADVEGKFYGDNAKELSGLFRDDLNNDSTWAGAFGASQ